MEELQAFYQFPVLDVAAGGTGMAAIGPSGSVSRFDVDWGTTITPPTAKISLLSFPGRVISVVSSGYGTGIGALLEDGSVSTASHTYPNPNLLINTVPLPDDRDRVVAIVGGEGSFYLVTAQGKLYTLFRSDTPLLSLAMSESILDAAMGLHWSAIITQTGKLYLYGSVPFYPEGQARPSIEPTLIPVPGRAIRVVAGYDHCVVLLENGELWGCGKSESGQLGKLTDQIYREVVQLHVPGRVVQIAAGAYSTLALTVGGRLYGFSYQLTNRKDYPLPIHIPFPSPVLSMAMGFCEVVVRLKPNEVQVFNQNRYSPSVIHEDRISPEPTTVRLR